MNIHTKPSLVVGGHLANASRVREKVRQDIAFLQDRIASLEIQHRPNQPVIDIYRTMLNSRQSVLSWLEHGELGADKSRAG